MKTERRFQIGIGHRRLLGGIAVGTLLAIIAYVYVPNLIDNARFSHEIDAQARQDAKAGAWPQAHDACVVCHGYEGNLLTQIYPRLAGQPAPYVVRQLTAFANGERNDPFMVPMASTLSATEVKSLAEYFAAQAPQPNLAFKPDARRVRLGEAKAKVTNCSSCHGPNLAGHDGFPRLAGQGHDYLVKQLVDFKSAARRDGNGSMAAVTAGLSAEDIENLAQYLATR